MRKSKTMVNSMTTNDNSREADRSGKTTLCQGDNSGVDLSLMKTRPPASQKQITSLSEEKFSLERQAACYESSSNKAHIRETLPMITHIPKVLLVGAGRFGRRHLRVLKELEKEKKLSPGGAIARGGRPSIEKPSLNGFDVKL